MKKDITKILLCLFIAATPFVPLYVIEPLKKGTDINVYSTTFDVYMYVFMNIMVYAWISTVLRLVNWLLKDWED